MEFPTEYALSAVGADGRVIAVSVVIAGESPAQIDVSWSGWSGRIAGGERFDFLDCMESLRRKLETDGYLLCCQGARHDAVPSGMSRDMSNGRLMYILRPDEPGPNELVDIFAPADCSQVVTFDQQKNDYLNYMRAQWARSQPGQDPAP